MDYITKILQSKVLFLLGFKTILRIYKNINYIKKDNYGKLSLILFHNTFIIVFISSY